MATQTASSSSSRLKIIVGSNTSSSEESTQSDATSTTNVTTDELTSSERRSIEGGGGQHHHRGVVVGDTTMEDVLPTYVLQPREISKNVDLMKTVAMLMESKLQQPLKGTDTEKLRDLYSDIQRFPEAYQKFSSIIHQIQYLNVTANWDISPGEPAESKSNILTKFLQSTKFKSESDQDNRKRVMINLLNELFRVFGRYEVIHTTLEERLKLFTDSIIKKSIQHSRGNETETTSAPIPSATDYSDEDDPQQPLLNRVEGGAVDRKLYANILEKVEALAEVLRKTRRQATDVHDSIEVLRDLINWDHKQVTSTSSFRAEGDCSGSYQQSSTQLPEVVVHPRSSHQSGCRSERSSQSRKVWFVAAAIITVLVLLLVITASLSFLRFNY